MTKKTPKEIEAQAREMTAEIRRHLGDDHPRIKEYTDVPALVESLTEQYSAAHEPSRFQVMIRTDGVKRRLLSIIVDEKNPQNKTWKRKSVAIEDFYNAKEINSAFLIQREVFVGSTSSDADTYLNMGRIRGDGIAIVEAFLLQNTDLGKYEFSQENINKLREEAKKQKKKQGVEALVVVGSVSYDDGKSNAYVVESKKNEIVNERFWIDPSRGYVCPLVQYYDNKGVLVREFKASDFFHEKKSGLWFPLLYSEFITAHDGHPVERYEYRVNSSTLKANFSVSDDEFFIDVPEGTTIKAVDRTPEVRYEALRKGSLSLAKGGLDLEKLDWLNRTSDIAKNTNNGFSGQIGASRLVRILLFFVGIIVVLVTAFRFLKTKKKSDKGE
ncbi:MAG: hypothetical protein LBQ66_12950 [Planctomycetaceae bacterium]|jgi:hypothetical protein|nr:hypothetical protein [Planctomycetaceae bacterium]